MIIGKQVLIPMYEISANENKAYIKYFCSIIQIWDVIVRVDQVQGALKSQVQRHGSWSYQLDKDAEVNLKKGGWQTARYIERIYVV